MKKIQLDNNKFKKNKDFKMSKINSYQNNRKKRKQIEFFMNKNRLNKIKFKPYKEKSKIIVKNSKWSFFYNKNNKGQNKKINKKDSKWKNKI